MDSSNILKPTATVNFSIYSKLKRFFGVFLLSDWVLGNAVNAYISDLNDKGLLGLGSDFRTTNLIWGETVWLNILHVLILAFTADLFGFIFGYLSRKLSLSEKIIFTSLYVFIRFLFLGLFTIIIDIFFPNFSAGFNTLISEAFFAISSSIFNATFAILGYIAMFASSLYFMKSGEAVINDPYYTIDKSLNGTLLDIKWYHYFWLFIPIGFYSQIILNLIYKTGHALVVLIQNFKWLTIFGVPDGNKGNAIDVAWGEIVAYFFISILVIRIMYYLRKILIGETAQHWAVKTLIVLAIGIVLPVLFLMYINYRG